LGLLVWPVYIRYHIFANIAVADLPEIPHAVAAKKIAIKQASGR